MQTKKQKLSITNDILYKPLHIDRYTVYDNISIVVELLFR